MPTLAVIWHGAGLLLATDTDTVIEVLPPVGCRPVPWVPPWVRGVFVYRGDLIPLIDAERLLRGLQDGSVAPEEDRMLNRVLVVRVASHAGAPIRAVGLWVRSVLELERIDFSGPRTHPGFSTESARFLGPIAQTRWGLVQLVSPADLLTAEHAETLSRHISEAAA